MEKVLVITITVFLIDVFAIMHKSILSKVNKDIPIFVNTCSTIFDVSLLLFSIFSHDEHMLTISIVLTIVNVCFYIAIYWNKIFQKKK